MRQPLLGPAPVGVFARFAVREVKINTILVFKSGRYAIYYPAGGIGIFKRAENPCKRGCYGLSPVTCWRADDKDRPFFHAADAGLPVVSLLYYYPYAPAEVQTRIKAVVKASMQFELAITHEVNNPFGYWPPAGAGYLRQQA